MPEARMRSTTSPGPVVGSGKFRISIPRLPRNTAPRMSSVLSITPHYVRIRVDPESRPLRHRQLALLRRERLAVELSVGPQVKVFEARLRRQRGDQVQRRERAGAVVRRVRRELDAV